MKLFNFIVVSIALGRSTVFAVPINEERDLVCLAHTILINVLTLNHGEKFCFDYLNIQTSTILTTTTKKTTTTQVLPAVTTTTTLFTGTEYVIYTFIPAANTNEFCLGLELPKLYDPIRLNELYS